MFGVPLWWMLGFVAIIINTAEGRLQVDNVTDTQAMLQWPNVTNTHVDKLEVTAKVVETYGPLSLEPLEWTFDKATVRAELQGLQPGSRYNICLASVPDLQPVSCQEVSTLVGDPEPPDPVDILETTGTQYRIRLHSGISDNGPITGYEVVVVTRSPMTVTFSPDLLSDYRGAREKGLPYYIAAGDLPANQTEFLVGDDKLYGGYRNVPLNPELQYHILQATVSTLNGVRKVAYSPLSTSFSTPLLFAIEPGAHPGSTLSVILAAAIGVSAFVLALSILTYFYLRWKFAKKRRSTDEMALHMHTPETEESMVLDTSEEGLERLKLECSVVPRSSLELTGTVLGRGQFGEVHQARLDRNHHRDIVMIHLVPDPLGMSEKERQSFLVQLSQCLRLGPIPNVVEFLGIVESPSGGGVQCVFEHWLSSLRGTLLRGRSNPGSMDPRWLLETAMEVARGMAGLADRGVVHGTLSSRNVLLSGECPKVSNFLLAKFDPLGKKLDTTRWKAPETINLNAANQKTDVWSFGVLLWEMCTFGSTPYSELPAADVPFRVSAGYRLGQPPGISTELFQLMLNCWQLDPDERPSFEALTQDLQAMVPMAKSLVDSAGLQCGRFDPAADLQSS